MKKLLAKSKELFVAPQSSIISAATIIMVMIVAARIVGLVRLRVLAHFFEDEQLSLFFAAFRLPDLLFEVMTFGALSSAFIPVFTKIYKKDSSQAFLTAAKVVNIGLLIFIMFSIVFGIFAESLYRVIAPGYNAEQVETVANLARVLFAAQGFFVVSYALTGLLESLRRFLVPALAPLFYNLGIILGVLVFTPSMGLLAPAIGVVFGACVHFLIQLPFAYKLGFRFVPKIGIDEGVRKIGKLALPRMVELGVLQISKMVELALASLISIASYTYYNFAFSVQALPIGLFGLSMAKAALPTLTAESDNLMKFRKTLLLTLYQVLFFVIPMASFLVVLRIPIVRLLFGTDIFGWEATVQTGYVLSSFAVGVPFQAAALLFSRGFYALHDTKTPVKVSLLGTLITVLSGIVLVLGMGLPTWGLAVAYTLGSLFQGVVLFYLLSRRINGRTFFAIVPMIKSSVAALVSAAVMFFILKFFDRSVWVKRLSFLNSIEISSLDFERFVLDTRYTGNLLVLTFITTFFGVAIYIFLNLLMRSDELLVIMGVFKRRSFFVPKKELEQVSPTPSETTS